MSGFLVTWHLWIVYNFMSCSLIVLLLARYWTLYCIVTFFFLPCVLSLLHNWRFPGKLFESPGVWALHIQTSLVMCFNFDTGSKSVAYWFLQNYWFSACDISHWDNIPVCCSATTNLKHLWTSASVLTAFQWCNELKGMSPLKRIRSCHMKCVQEYFICAVYSVRQMYSVMLFMKWIQGSHEGTTLKKDHRGTSLALAWCHECHGRLLILELVYPCAICCCVCDD